MFSDNAKIGTFLLTLSALCFVFGILFLFDAALLALADVLFLLGLVLLIGPSRTVRFFTRKERMRGIISFFLGILLVFVRWSVTGIILQFYGILYLFGSFLPIVANSLQGIPVIGPFLSSNKVESFVDGFGKSERRAPV